MKRYAEYKDSGIEWIGEIPKDWVISKVKYEFINLDSKRKPINSESRGDMIGEYDYYGASGVIDKIDDYIFDESLLLIGEDGANLVFRNLPLIYIGTGKYWVNNHAHILKPKEYNELYYWAYQLECIDLFNYITGSAQPKLTQENLSSIPVIVPTTREKQGIVDYLDCKTADIDTLIADKQNLIDLLKEKRQAIISEAVTKGLDKTAKMKDSGIDWIGEIPEGWEVIQLKFASISGISNGIFCEKAKLGKGVKLINVVNLYTDNGIDIDNLELLDVFPKEYEQYKVVKNDLFYTRSSLKLEGIGQCNINLSDEKLIYECHIMKITPDVEKVIPKYIYYYSNSSVAKIDLMKKAKTTTMTTINQQDLGSVALPLPAKDMQQHIVTYLDIQTVRIDNLISDITTQIEKLKEYRQSVISEVITGKVAM